MPERQYSNDGRFFQQRHPVRMVSQHRDETLIRDFTNLQEMLKKTLAPLRKYDILLVKESEDVISLPGMYGPGRVK